MPRNIFFNQRFSNIKADKNQLEILFKMQIAEPHLKRFWLSNSALILSDQSGLSFSLSQKKPLYFSRWNKDNICRAGGWWGGVQRDGRQCKVKTYAFVLLLVFSLANSYSLAVRIGGILLASFGRQILYFELKLDILL